MFFITLVVQYLFKQNVPNLEALVHVYRLVSAVNVMISKDQDVFLRIVPIQHVRVLLNAHRMFSNF